MTTQFELAAAVVNESDSLPITVALTCYAPDESAAQLFKEVYGFRPATDRQMAAGRAAYRAYFACPGNKEDSALAAREAAEAVFQPG